MRSTVNKAIGRYNWQTGIVLLVAVLAIAACGEKPEEPTAPESASPKLFEAQREALEKAKAVELEVEKRAEALRQQEEQQTK